MSSVPLAAPAVPSWPSWHARAVACGRSVGRRASEPWPKRVEAVTADILQADEVRKACRDAAVVYHAANVLYAQWQQVLPATTESVIAAASAAW